MIRRDDGGVSVFVLGVSLMLLLLVAGLGLAEGARAKAARTEAMRALIAATQSAARAPVAEQQTAFMSVLKANLGPSLIPYRADLQRSPEGVTGRLRMPFSLHFLGKWLPPFTFELTHTETVLKRKPRP